MTVYVVVSAYAVELDSVHGTRESAQTRANYLMSIFPTEKWIVRPEEVC